MTDLDELATAVERPDSGSRRKARDLLGHEGTGDRLVELAIWLAAAQGRVPATPPVRSRLLVLGDTAPARTVSVAIDTGVELRVVGRRELAPGNRDEALAAVLAGAALADEEVDGGADLLLLALPDPGLAVPGAAVTGLLTTTDASAVTATGQDDAAWMAACAATRDAMRRGRPAMADHVALLAAVGTADLAVATGVLLRAAARRTPVLLDGPAVAAAALVAARLAFRAADWWQAANLSPDPAHGLALARLSLEPVLDLGLRGDDGIGALLAVPLLRAAVGG